MTLGECFASPYRIAYSVNENICGAGAMKNITVSVDDDTYRLSRVKAAEAGTSVSALVRGYLNTLVGNQSNGPTAERRPQGDEFERRRRLMNDVIEEITSNGGGLRMADNLPREALHDRNALRHSLAGQHR